MINTIFLWNVNYPTKLWKIIPSRILMIQRNWQYSYVIYIKKYNHCSWQGGVDESRPGGTDPKSVRGRSRRVRKQETGKRRVCAGQVSVTAHWPAEHQCRTLQNADNSPHWWGGNALCCPGHLYAEWQVKHC